MTSTSSALLEARGLHRFFRRGDDEVAALRDVTFSVQTGEMVAVVGPSGSGKSTLLNLLAGLDNPDGGSVWIAGERFSHRSAGEQTRRRGQNIGVLTQASGLIEHLSVAGNVRLADALRHRAGGMSRRTSRLRNAAVQELLDRLGIGHRSQARPSTLSGGETARANLAVAMVGSPRVLLADEPTAEVSSSEEAGILQLLVDVRPAVSAMVLVTHSPAVAAAADRILTMSSGRLR